MLNKIVEAISAALEKNYPENEIYINKIKQGFKEPCFFIQPLNPSEKHILSDRYLRTYDFCITFFSKEDNRKLMEISDILNEILEVIELENRDLLRGLDRHSEFIDGKLHYFVTYKIFMRKSEEEEFMGSVDTKVRIGGKNG